MAVAVTNCPLGTFVLGLKVKDTLPSEPVVTLVNPSTFLPSALSVEGLEKKSMRKVVLGALLRVALMVVSTAPVLAEAMTGLFCSSFAPVSASPASLGVSPSPPRSMPREPLEKIEFCLIWLPSPEVTLTPSRELPRAESHPS